MAASIATSGFGTLIKKGDGASPTEAFTSIAEVKSINGPSLSMETLDATHMESPSNFREIKPSFLSAGEISVEMNFLPAAASQVALTTQFSARGLTNYQIVWTDSGTTTWQAACYVTGYQPNASIDALLAASLTLMVSGAPNFSV